MSEIRVLIVEDEPLIAQDISDLLNDINFTTAGIAHDSATAIDMLKSRHADIALLDITIMGQKDGVDLAEIIKSNYGIPHVFLTSHSDKMTLDRAKKTLPYGYIVKPFNENDLLSTIEMALFRYAHEKKDVLPTRSVINDKLGIALTVKEYTCLQHIYEGATNKQMAEQQFVSVNTVKTHLKNLFSKLDVPNRTSAIQKVISL